MHIPFCSSRCYYCDFASTSDLGRSWQERYRAALRKELRSVIAGAIPAFQTIYIGGGTPTYLDDDVLEGIIADLHALNKDALYTDTTMQAAERGNMEKRIVPASAAIEFTVEANPGTLSKSKLEMLYTAGCNRLSIGAQSFDDRRLAWLGRSHDAAAFRQAWTLAREAGFSNMSLDLMYGLPGQTVEDWRRTLLEALTYQPEHISLYQLSIEPGTVLAQKTGAGLIREAGEEICRAQYLLTHEVLTGAGYLHYEISNYAKPGYESRHNTMYWRNGCYIGLGAGASGYLPGRRYTNKADLEAYLADLEAGRPPVAEVEQISPDLVLAEEMMLAFRLREGIAKERLSSQRQITLSQKYGQALDKYIAAGLLEDNDGRISPTVEGWLQYNSWIQDFL